ncbi:MAG: cell division protein SepF [Erysipelotrichaceae bacterium]|nr:cell division protein SepF [Erysipelotrichaceae bacterium]
MGLFKKIKSNLFKDDDDKLIHDSNEKSLRNLNTQYRAELEKQQNISEPVSLSTPEEVTIKEPIKEEKQRVFNSDFASSFVNNDKEYTPRTFEETEEIANQIIRGTKVTVDTSMMKKEDIVRMLDFLSGMMFALKGEIIRESKFVFTFYVE